MSMNKITVAKLFGLALLVAGWSSVAVAQTGVLFVEGSRVGVGIATPSETLHVKGTDGLTKLHVEEASATVKQRELYLLSNNGGVRFAFEDTSTGRRISMRNVNAQFQMDMNNDLLPELRLAANGNLTITGSLFTAGGTCGGGCDAVFQPGSDVPSIENHASEMWAKSYLPAVGPTPENQPINLSTKTAGMLNELEKAHIYIAQLNDALKEKEARLLRLEQENRELRNTQADLGANLQALEAQVQSVLKANAPNTP